MSTRQARRPLTVESLVVAALVLFGFRAGLRGISDNSAFVHIRTGIEMIAHGSIPRTDPYSFTAPGHAWVVQSWLASAVYGVAYRGAGMHLVVFVNGVIGAVLAWTLATLARAGTVLRTMVAAPLAVIGGSAYWAPRPLMFGLICLALLILVVERRANPWWLIPIVWVWVNTHGSFPLGLAWLVAVAVGAAIDTRRRPRDIERYVVAFVGSLAFAAVNPLGPKLLAFPFAIRDKASVFKNVVEWRSPDFQSGNGLFTLACIALILVVILRARLPWRDIFPVVGFLALGLISVRNLSPAIVVFSPVLGRAMSGGGAAATDAAPTELVPTQPSPGVTPGVNLLLAGVLVVTAVVFTVGAQRASALDLRTYPTKAVTYMVPTGLLDPTKHRVAAQDIVGCYLVLLKGPRGKVFIDDRVDMYPISVSQDYDALLHGDPGSPAILDRYRVDTVLWDRHLSLVGVLQAAGGWRMAYPAPSAPSTGPSAERWVVLERDPLVAPGHLS